MDSIKSDNGDTREKKVIIDFGSGDASGGVGDNVDHEQNECAICLNDLDGPVDLPCGHTFCSDCLDSWRSKYVPEKEKKCPTCRGKIPVTKQMVSRLSMYQHYLYHLEAVLDTTVYPLPTLPEQVGEESNQESYEYGPISNKTLREIHQLPPEQHHICLKALLEQAVQEHHTKVLDLDEQVGDGTVLLEEHSDCDYEQLSFLVTLGAQKDIFEEVLAYLGDLPIPPERINARNDKNLGRIILHEAKNTNLMYFFYNTVLKQTLFLQSNKHLFWTPVMINISIQNPWYCLSGEPTQTYRMKKAVRH